MLNWNYTWVIHFGSLVFVAQPSDYDSVSHQHCGFAYSFCEFRTQDLTG